MHIAGDVWCTDGEFLKNEAFIFFKKLFIHDTPICRREGILLVTNQLGPEAVTTFLKEVLKDEVWEALKFMKAFKVSGPDGFHPFFFEHF